MVVLIMEIKVTCFILTLLGSTWEMKSRSIAKLNDTGHLHLHANMGLLPDTKIAGCACAGNAGNVFPSHWLQLAIPTCITARAWRTCRDACQDRLPAVAGKTFPAFPAHVHTQFYVSGKRLMAKMSVTMLLTSFVRNIPFSAAVTLNISLWHQRWYARLTETRCIPFSSDQSLPCLTLTDYQATDVTWTVP